MSIDFDLKGNCGTVSKSKPLVSGWPWAFKHVGF
jgi:hypothetical protein